MSPGERAAVLTVAALGVGIMLNALQTPLYRLLEGYSWPKWLRDACAARHREKKKDLEKKAAAASGLDEALYTERLSRYPVDNDQVTATRLGNAIRAFETYAYDRFRIDSQTLWGELVAQAPESTQTETDRARASVDFCVCSFYLALIFGTLATAVGCTQSHHQVTLLISGIIAVITVPLWYGLAVVSTSNWQTAVQAVVNLGRVPLASALGLRLPATLKEERSMWEQVNYLVGFPYDEQRAADINLFRISAPARMLEGGGEVPPVSEQSGAATDADSAKPGPQLGEGLELPDPTSSESAGLSRDDSG